MSSLEEVLQVQKDTSVLRAPAISASNSKQSLSAQTDPTMNFAIVNTTGSSNVYAYVSGLAIQNNNAVFMLESDGSTVLYPSSPDSTGKSLTANTAIKLGAPGSTTTITVPQTAGGRIWFSQNATLTFLLNPGPALVEPSVTNLFVNITYVDFVSLPIALQLENNSGLVTTVAGTPSNGLDTVCSALTAQSAADGAGWKDLIVKDTTGANLRALSPNSGIVMNNSLFNGYFQPYVDKVWAKYATTNLQVDTQASYGIVSGAVDSSSKLAFGDAGSFPQPSAADIFSCSTGAFAVGTDEMANLAARLAAAFNRSTLLVNSNQPDGEQVSTYYADPVTNHYARIVHATNSDRKGYAFPYDDVGPSEGADQSGSLFDPNPKLLTVTVGGLSSTSSAAVSARDHAIRLGQRPAGRRSHPGPMIARRDLEGEGESEKPALAHSEPAGSRSSGSSSSNDDVSEGVDLETGLGSRGKQDSFSDDVKSLLLPLFPRRGSGKGAPHAELSSSTSSLASRSLTSFVPRRWADRVASALGRLERRFPPAMYASAKPAVDLVVRLVTVFLSMSVRTFLSRVTMGFLLVLFYVLAPVIRGSAVGGDGAEPLVGQAAPSTTGEVGMVMVKSVGTTPVLVPE
ncbi:glucanase b [Diaporthe eres]|nr:glucanase b [Diaporthe eres]